MKHTLLAALALALTVSIHAQSHDARVIPLDGPGWHLATDPNNVGLGQKWCEKPSGETLQVKCPSIIQDAFPGYHGVAWYWREFLPPANPHADGRYLLRFWQVDYLADVWVNGVHVGRHEGGEDPFVLDSTDAVKPGASNLLVVRVLNPTHAPIDGISLALTPRRNKAYPPTAGCDYNYGGITDAVELLLTPAVRIENLFVRPDPKTGRIRIQANLRNAGKSAATVKVGFAVSPAAGGETLDIDALDRDLPPGDTLVEAELTVQNAQLWELNQPTLYQVSAQVGTSASAAIDQQTARCGFRDFRFEDGSYQLNGKRLFLKCSHSGCELPGIRVAIDPDMLRKDLLNCKVMGFNAIRFIAGIPPRLQLELCDEIGLMVYEECFAGWCLGDSPKMAERFDHATRAMILRDRNHPSIVMWGLLNETKDGAVFRHAVDALPLVRAVDDTRLVMLNSGRFDKTTIGSLANPGTDAWQDVLDEQHPYQGVPHTAGVIHTLRTLGRASHPMFISENGTGSALDLPRLARHFEQWRKTSSEDALYYRDKLDRFMADWTRWNLSDTFANPEDYFRQCLTQMAPLRSSEISAIRANPNVVAYSLTGTQDQGLSGEGLTTLFRELKPGTMDAVFDALYPLRWCLFVEPMPVRRGQNVRLEAVLANEDQLVPGDYPVRLQVVGPHAEPVFDRTLTVKIPDPMGKPAPKFAVPVFADNVRIDGPSGKYRFLATFLKGGAAAGGDVGFYVSDPADLPKVKTEVVRWGDDPELSKWLIAHGIKTRDFVAGERQTAREVILVGNQPAAGGGKAFRELAEHIARGSQVVFLKFDVFKKDDQNPTGWLPFATKGALTKLPAWLYHKDDWAKNHPIFDGLPAGGILDTTFYRDIISNTGFSGQQVPSEVVAGMIDASSNYGSALTLGIYKLGSGRFFLNTLRIREFLPSHPGAERLLLNMLRYAAQDVAQPPAELPADFGQQLDAFGY